MTIDISDNTPRVSYTVSQGATTTSFAVSFEFFDDADLNVYVDGTLKTITTDYTVSGGNGSTGSVSISVTGATGGSTVVITRDIALERTTDFPLQGAFQIASLNTELDRITAITADLKDSSSRSLQLTDYDAAVSLVLPDVDTRKGKTLAFNASSGAVEAGPSIADVQTVSGASADIQTLAHIEDGTDATDAIQAVAAIASNVTTVAGKASLITSDFVSDLNALAVSDVIADINTLATSDIVSDINLLATSDIVSDLNTLATSAIVTDLNILATSDIVSDINLLATSDIVSDLNTLATSDFVSDLNAVATSAVISDLDTVATNVAGVQSFAARYRVGSSDPSSDLDAGDLFYNTSTNLLKRYNGSAWVAIESGIGNLVEDISPQLGGALASNGQNVEMSAATKVQFRDSAIFINSSTDGQLDINADTEIQIVAPAVDLNGDLDVSGDVDVGDDVTVAGRASGHVTTDNDGSFDLAVGNDFKCTTAGGLTLTFTNPLAGQSGNIMFINGGNHAIAAHASVAVSAATLTAISATGTYHLAYYCSADSGNNTILVSASAALT